MCTNQGKGILEEIEDSFVEEMVASMMANMEKMEVLGSVDAESTAIVDAYVSCERMVSERQRLYDILARRYPSMRFFAQEARNPARNFLVDVADKKLENMDQRRKFGLIRSEISMAEALCVVTEEELPSEVIEAQRVLSVVEPLAEKMRSILDGQFTHYLKIAQESRDEAKSRGVDTVEAMESQDFRDTVFRRAYPTREEGEEFDAFMNESAFQSVVSARGVCRTMRRGIGDENEKAKIEAQMKQFPTPRAMDALLGALREYHAREFDRIYGAAQTV